MVEVAAGGVVVAAAGGGVGTEGSNPLTNVTVISLAPAVGMPAIAVDNPRRGVSVAIILASFEFFTLTTIPFEVVRVKLFLPPPPIIPLSASVEVEAALLGRKSANCEPRS